LQHLKILEAEECQLLDISFVASLTGLETLKLKMNGIKDLTPLAGLTKLKVLDISYNAVEDPLPLLKLANFKTMTLSYEPNPLSEEKKKLLSEALNKDSR
jgi:internalin A